MRFQKGDTPHNKGKLKAHNRVCTNCGKDFVIYGEKKSRVKCCSEECKKVAQVGRFNGTNRPVGSGSKKGHPVSKKTKDKISKSLKGRKRPEMTGEKHFAWNGGNKVYGEHWTNELKEKIRERDYMCFMCLKREEKLDVHHIDYNPKNCKEDNLICLCRSCHCKTNFKRKYWQTYFQSAVKRRKYFVWWLIGKSGSGKSTLARKLLSKDMIWLDGDVMREVINKDLGFSSKDREENNLRIAKLAKHLNMQGFPVLVSTICPTKKLRKKIKEICNPAFMSVDHKDSKGRDDDAEFEHIDGLEFNITL